MLGFKERLIHQADRALRAELAIGEIVKQQHMTQEHRPQYQAVPSSELLYELSARRVWDWQSRGQPAFCALAALL